MTVSANNRYINPSSDESDGDLQRGKGGKDKKNDKDDASDDSDSSILLEGPEFSDPESEAKRRRVWKLAMVYDNLREMFQVSGPATRPRWYV
eukprot:979721-Alexandrium_andersonii.AAC.1